MHTQLRAFLTRFTGVVIISLVPVVFTAFVTLPLVLGHQPGETNTALPVDSHMT